MPKVISCNEHKREVSVSQNLANKQVDRIFTFDKVCFCIMIYVSPMGFTDD